MEWDKRISHALERSKREKRNRGHGTGSDNGTQKGVPVSENGTAMNGIADEEDFSTAPFQYHPPAYGAVGQLPESESEELADTGPGANRTEKVDRWMSGGNGTQQEKTIPLSPADNADDTNGQSNSVDDCMFSGMNGNFHNQPPDNDTTGVDETNDFRGAFDWPFDNDEQYAPDFATDQNDPILQTAFDNLDGPLESFNFGTQEISETQIAEKIHGEFAEFLDRPSGGEVDLSGSPFKLDLGTSILGKRKTSPVQDAHGHIKKHMPAEVEDSFEGGENYVTGSAAGYGDDVNLDLMTDDHTAAVDDQLLNEMVHTEAIDMN